MDNEKMIPRPFNRVKFMVWPKMKLGVIDLVVFSIFFISGFVIGFLVFEEIVARLVFAIGSVLIGGILLIGQPSRRVYNYLYLMFLFIISKKKFKKDEVTKLNSYKTLSDDYLITNNGRYERILFLEGNNILNDLDGVRLRKLTSFYNMLISQNSNLQFVKMDDKFEVDSYIKSLDELDASDETREKVISEKKDVLRKIAEGKNIFPNYFLILSSSKLSDLNRDSIEISSELKSSGINSYKLVKKKLLSFVLRRYSFYDEYDFSGLDYKDLKIDNIFMKYFDNKVKYGASYYKIGSTYSRKIAIDRLPLKSSIGWLANLFNMEDVVVEMDIKHVSTEAAVKSVDKIHREMRTRYMNNSMKVSESSLQGEYLSSLEELSKDISSGAEELKHVNIYITINAKSINQLKSQERFVLKEVRKSKMLVDGLIFNQKSANIFFAPSIRMVEKTKFQDRNQLQIGTIALTQGWPFISQSFNDPSGDYIGNAMWGKPSFIDWALRDNKINRVQSNSVIFGSTGSGKSTFVNRTLRNEWTRGVNSYVIDPEGEYDGFVLGLGGRSINLSGKKNSKGIIERINPLQPFTFKVDTDDDGLLSDHYKFLSAFFAQLIFHKGDDSKKHHYLKYAIQMLYKKFKIDSSNLSKIKNDKFPTITDLWKVLASLSKKSDPIFTNKDIFQDLSEMLYTFTKNGEDGLLWDGYTTVDISKEKIVNFNIKDLYSSGDTKFIAAQSYLILKYLEHIIYNNSKIEKNQKVSITIDEAHMIINRDNILGVKFAFNMYKRIRKYNGWIRMTTQNIGDFTADENIKHATMAMINNVEFLISFFLKPSDINDLDILLKSKEGLTKSEKAMLNRNISHDFLLMSGFNRTLIEGKYSREELKSYNWSDEQIRELGDTGKVI